MKIFFLCHSRLKLRDSRTFYNCLIGLLFYFMTFHSMATMIVRDDEGHRLSLPKPAGRIISLSPHITELLFAAGGGDHVVGAIKYSDYPEAAKNIPIVGDSRELDIERIIMLKPDLLVVSRQANSTKQIEQLQQLGVPLFFNHSHQLEDIPTSIQLFGQLMGTEIQANKKSAELRYQLAELSKKYTNRPSVKVFYQIWDNPLFTLNGQSIVSDAIELCGGINIFSSLKTTAPNVSSEAVLQKDPEAIVATIDEDPTSSGSGAAMWKRYPTMTAVKQGNLFELDADLINRPGPRMILGTKNLCEKLELARQHRKNKYQ